MLLIEKKIIIITIFSTGNIYNCAQKHYLRVCICVVCLNTRCRSVTIVVFYGLNNKNKLCYTLNSHVVLLLLFAIKRVSFFVVYAPLSTLFNNQRVSLCIYGFIVLRHTHTHYHHSLALFLTSSLLNPQNSSRLFVCLFFIIILRRLLNVTVFFLT